MPCPSAYVRSSALELKGAFEAAGAAAAEAAADDGGPVHDVGRDASLLLRRRADQVGQTGVLQGMIVA